MWVGQFNIWVENLSQLWSEQDIMMEQTSERWYTADLKMDEGGEETKGAASK